MVDERYGRKNMNIQSIVSAVTMPNSVNRVNSNGLEIVLKMRFLSQEILNNPVEVLRQTAQLFKSAVRLENVET